jgi:hypothetical protein
MPGRQNDERPPAMAKWKLLAALAAAATVSGAALVISSILAEPDVPRPRAHRQPPPRPTEPQAREARWAVMHRDAEAIEAECRHAAAGDWDTWQRDTAPCRAALKARIDGLKRLPTSQSVPLPGLLDFPLFEVRPAEVLNYLYDPATLDGFRRNRPVLAVHRWLRGQGIDLILVPVPRMTEVYVEHFVDPVPLDGIIAPHVRRALLELLQQDVEVVDALRALRAARDRHGEFLYNAADTHWALRGMRAIAREVAGRIGRYEFGRAAREGPRVVNATPRLVAKDLFPRDGWEALSERQRELAGKAQPRGVEHLTRVDGGPLYNDPESPVFVIGNSYAHHFCEQLVNEMNLLIARRIGDHNTTEAFADFLREPELLDRTRVVVWVLTEHHLTRFTPLPGVIGDCLKSANASP